MYCNADGIVKKKHSTVQTITHTVGVQNADGTNSVRLETTGMVIEKFEQLSHLDSDISHFSKKIFFNAPRMSKSGTGDKKLLDKCI